MNNHGKAISVKHKIKSRNGWIENYVSLVKEDQDECPIDFYEYYWAFRMERKIAFKEIIDWLIKTSDGARKFYDEIVLIGHSPGSVIAFDTLNRVNHAMNANVINKALANKI